MSVIKETDTKKTSKKSENNISTRIVKETGTKKAVTQKCSGFLVLLKF